MIDLEMSGGHDPASGSHAGASGIDLLSDLLQSVRLTGSMLFLVDASTPWVSWAPQAEAFRPVVLPGAQHLVSFHIVTHGRCWAGLVGEAPEPFEEGDALVIAHGDAYYLADPPQAQLGYGADEAVAFFRDMAAGRLSSTVIEGGGGPIGARFICGFLGCDRRPFNPLLSALPRLLRVPCATPSGGGMSHLIAFALDELRRHRPGGQGVRLRMAELLFLAVLRRHLEGASQDGWLAGLRDPVVAQALALLHQAPALHWSLDRLAVQCGTSRTVLAGRFAKTVGQPTMHYLAQWRMQLASRLLLDGDAKLLTVAEAVGYESEAAFGRAFKKCVGVSPGEWRRGRAPAARAMPDGGRRGSLTSRPGSPT